MIVELNMNRYLSCKIAPIALLTTVAIIANVMPSSVAQDAIPIAKIQHEGQVDFEKEVVPILRRNCLACHSSTKAESKLSLESPQSIIKGGGEGPGVVPGKPTESLLLLLASRQRESFMPPDDNNVGAKKLTSDELGLLQLWIEQGAKGEVSNRNKLIEWQSLPPGINPIYAVAITDDGQFAAAGRANQIFMYHVPSQRELGRLTDPSLAKTGLYKQGVADLELIQALTFSPDGQRLVSGGFRTAKIWNRQPDVKLAEIPGIASPAESIALSADGKLAAIGERGGAIRIVNSADNKIIASASGHSGTVTGLAFSRDGQTIYSSSLDKTWRTWKVDGSALSSIETQTPLLAIAVVDDSKRVAVGCEDNSIRLWNVPAAGESFANQPAATLTGHSKKVTSLAAMKDGQLLSGSLDGTARLWQSRDGKQVRELNHGGPVVAVTAGSDGIRLATASHDSKSIKIWNVADGKL
jgi:WD40 repeat protein